MSALSKIVVMINYEWKRALAKKKIWALVILSVAFQALVMIALSWVASNAPTSSFIDRSYAWILGVMEGQTLFIPLIAIITAGGSMSEEYEHGTADILLSKPITRLEYLFGKFLGGFSSLAMIEALITLVGVVLSLGFFGSQTNLQFAPIMFLAIVYSSLIFFSLSFMFSEVFRGSTLAMLAAFGILIASSVISTMIGFLWTATRQSMYLYLSRGIPTWAATSFPQLLLSALINGSTVLAEADLVALYQAAIIIAVYAIIFIMISVFRLLKSDVSKKTG
jgi:ABC-2 type transport system permease protein